MKRLLIILITFFSSYGYGQAEYEKIAITDNVKQNSATRIMVQDSLTKQINWVLKSNLPISSPVLSALQKKVDMPTGFITGLQLSINADPTKFNIASGYYIITDYTDILNPVVTIKTYAGISGITPTYLASANASYIALDINGNIVQSSSPFTNDNRRTLAIIGSAVHSNHTSINVTNEVKAPIIAIGNQLHDLMKAIGFLNEEGNIYAQNGANLQINKSAGKISGLGINANNYLNPNQLTIASQTALTFAYRLRGGTQFSNTTSIDPNNYDNAGVLTATGTGNKWTVQRINLFQSGLTRIQYGQTIYTSFADALAGLRTDDFVTEQNISENSIFRSYLIVKQGTTNLSSEIAAGTARFIPVDKFGNIVGNSAVALTYANIIAALGYTPEDVANKATSFGTINNTLYPSVQAVSNYATTGSGTINKLPIFTASKTLGDSFISQSGYSVGVNGVIVNDNPGDPAHVFNITNDAGDSAKYLFQATAYANNTGYANVHIRKARGTAAVPLAVLNQDILSSWGFRGYAATKFASSSAAIQAIAEQNFTDTANGTSLLFQVTGLGVFDSRIDALRLKTTGEAQFYNTILAGVKDGIALKFQSATPTGSAFLRFYNSAGTQQGYIGNFGSANTLILDNDVSPITINTPTLTLGGLTGSVTSVANISSTGVVSRGAVVPLRYTALISQSGTSDPVVSIIENTIGTIVWTRSGVGAYLGTLTGAFPSTKTIALCTTATFGGSVYPTLVTIGRQDNNSVFVVTRRTDSVGTNVDTQLSNSSIKIEVYP